MGIMWSYLERLEVTRWQALNKWMYRVAVSRAQMRVSLPQRIYFLRQGQA